MADKTGIVRNPLTVIAIFAGLAETSGTIVLPLLDAHIQTTYVWFLMAFPGLLVTLFFTVLYLKHEVLYAPSDFADQGHFIKFVPARLKILKPEQNEDAVEPTAEETDLSKMAVESSADEAEKDIHKDEIHKERRRYVIADYVSDKYMALSRKEQILDFFSKSFDVQFSGPAQPKNLKSMVFDGIASRDNKQYMVIVKDLFFQIPGDGSINKFIKRIHEFYDSLSSEQTDVNKLIPCFALPEDFHSIDLIKHHLYNNARHGKLHILPVHLFVFNREKNIIVSRETINLDL